MKKSVSRNQSKFINKASGTEKPPSSISGRGARVLHHDEAKTTPENRLLIG